MKIYRCVQTNNKTQDFGANIPCVIKGARPFQFVPCGTPNSHKLYTGELNQKGHNGVDWATYYKEPVYFNVDIPGVEWEADTQIDSAGSVHVIVRSKQPVPLAKIPLHEPGSLKMIQKQYDTLVGKLYIQMRYDHLYQGYLFNKAPVVLGQCIGLADSTGASTGNHVHETLKVSDTNSWFYIDGDNGYSGGIDPDQYRLNTFVLDVIKEKSSDIIGLQLEVIKLSNIAISLLRKLIDIKSKNKHYV